MITHAKIKFKSRWNKWARRRHASGNPQTIDSRNLYIFPSGFGWAYGAVVMILLTSAINYQINTIFLMTILLVMIGMLSAYEAHANLLNLTFQFVAVEDAQQETPAKISLIIRANTKNRFGIALRIASQPETRLEQIPPEGLQFIIPIETVNRGYFPLPPIIITSVFPFDIFRVWGYLYFDEHYYVYPKPEDPGFWPNPNLDANKKSKNLAGDEEFYDLKQVENPWQEPKLISWKLAAKGQGWYLKRMSSNEVDYWLFKLNDLPSRDIESKLRNLSFWLQTAEDNGLVYGLELPSVTTPFSRGKDHLQHCLRQLALFK